MRTMLFACLVGLFVVYATSCGLPPDALELHVVDGAQQEPTPTADENTQPTPDAETPPHEAAAPEDASAWQEPSEPSLEPTPEPLSEALSEPHEAPADDASAEPIDDMGWDASGPERGPEPTPEPAPEPAPLPTFPHFDRVIDLHRGSDQAWASLIYFAPGGANPPYQRVTYKQSGDQVDFWPASTIKTYVATATLVLLKQYGMSLDATATFYYRNGSAWVRDTSKTFRTMIHDTITCSSNTDYTLLLRFVGLDWLNMSFLTKQHGFTKTALMQGYVSARPYGYQRGVGQRIAMKDGASTAERIHTWSGTSYANQIPCTVSNSSGGANCTSPNDLVEHMRRLFFHEQLPTSSQFSVRRQDLDWLRYGSPGKPVLGSRCTKGGWDGIKKVLPGASYYHKPGSVTNYRLDMGYIDDPTSGTRYAFAIALRASSTRSLVKISEEVARMVLTPSHYVHLASLKDGVNPVGASLTVYAERPGTLDLITKPFAQDPTVSTGWTPLPGASVQVPRGISSHQLRSRCRSRSEKLHVMGRLEDPLYKLFAYSDLHFVVVDANVPCP